MSRTSVNRLKAEYVGESACHYWGNRHTRKRLGSARRRCRRLFLCCRRCLLAALRCLLFLPLFVKLLLQRPKVFGLLLIALLLRRRRCRRRRLRRNVAWAGRVRALALALAFESTLALASGAVAALQLSLPALPLAERRQVGVVDAPAEGLAGSNVIIVVLP
mgnify:CR=1 FL=1